ncbi:hypothetical protein HanIR_Chr13g0657831 [Helianthus annuus]|nr:hypothetical protein HanIR_Chr13g0657831 [Helianthus annuus]
MFSNMRRALKQQIFSLKFSTFIKQPLKHVLVCRNRRVLFKAQSFQELQSINNTSIFRNIPDKRLGKRRVIVFSHQP